MRSREYFARMSVFCRTEIGGKTARPGTHSPRLEGDASESQSRKYDIIHDPPRLGGPIGVLDISITTLHAKGLWRDNKNLLDERDAELLVIKHGLMTRTRMRDRWS